MPDEDKGPLGKRVDAPDVYSPSILFPIPRSLGRATLGLPDSKPPPFAGEDVWNAYELSWLDGRGWPRRGVLELRVPADTPHISESKSLKLYLNSLSFTRFSDQAALLGTVADDLGRVLGGPAPPRATLLEVEPPLLDPTAWRCVDEFITDDLPDEAFAAPEPAHLRTLGAPAVTERLVSHVLRTLCPVTGQPDWGSVLVEYAGPPLCPAGLLRYLVSLRREVGFHENAIERIFLAIWRQCAPSALRVTGRFFRRGGIDINPVRASLGAEAVLGPASPQLRIPGQ
jgi:7-cyano-7-deazaguanine reductase